MVAYSHAGETLLNSLRDKKTEITPKVVTGLLVFFDGLASHLKYVLDNKAEPNDDFTSEISAITELADNLGTVDNATQYSSIESIETIEDIDIDEIAESNNSSDSTENESKVKSIEPQSKAPAPKNKENNTIRVDVKFLDKMMDMVGELVLSRNQVLQIVEENDISILNAACGHLNYVTRKLQENIMETRMQPIVQVWNKFPRIVRDFCISSGKKIKVSMSG